MPYRTEHGTILPNDYWQPNGYSTEAIIRMTSTEKRSTGTLPDAGSGDAGICICKSAFREQRHTPIGVSITTYCEAHVLDIDQWHTAHAWCNWRILPPSNDHQRVTYEHRRPWRCQEQQLTSLPKVKTSRRCKRGRDWVYWDASYDSKSTGRTNYGKA